MAPSHKNESSVKLQTKADLDLIKFISQCPCPRLVLAPSLITSDAHHKRYLFIYRLQRWTVLYRAPLNPCLQGLPVLRSAVWPTAVSLCTYSVCVFTALSVKKTGNDTIITALLQTDTYTQHGDSPHTLSVQWHAAIYCLFKTPALMRPSALADFWPAMLSPLYDGV